MEKAGIDIVVSGVMTTDFASWIKGYNLSDSGYVTTEDYIRAVAKRLSWSWTNKLNSLESRIPSSG